MKDAAPAPADRPLIWPLWLRLGHWTGVVCVLVCSLSGFGWWGSSDLHETAGWVLVALVLGRLCAGLGARRQAGQRPSWTRWAQFVRGPGRTLAYGRALLHGRAPRHLGHNPLGAWMIVALLGALAALGVTGGLLTTDAWWGDPDLAGLHEALALGLLGLVAGHLTGVVGMSWGHRENLVAAMLTGRKRRRGDEPDADPTAGGTARITTGVTASTPPAGD